MQVQYRYTKNRFTTRNEFMNNNLVDWMVKCSAIWLFFYRERRMKQCLGVVVEKRAFSMTETIRNFANNENQVHK